VLLAHFVLWGMDARLELCVKVINCMVESEFEIRHAGLQRKISSGQTDRDFPSAPRQVLIFGQYAVTDYSPELIENYRSRIDR